ncbi:MAG: DUF6089 family protein [Mariniphaga sp.]|nr:DUF6089 family protein [Mariniphaga sp.]
MRKIILVFLTVVLTVSGFAQKSADVGIWGGTSTYWGDIEKAPPLQTFNLNVGAFFRYNFNARIALRTSILTGSFASEGYVEDVPFEFRKNAQDFSVMVEINYLRYIMGDKKTRFTPYIMGGIGLMDYVYQLDAGQLRSINPDHPHLNGTNVTSIDPSTTVAPVIPFGFGVKFSAGNKLEVGAEYQIRKLFNDKLDNMDDPLSFEKNNVGVEYSDFWHKNDWPGYLGVFITYKIFMETKDCPAYDRKYW